MNIDSTAEELAQDEYLRQRWNPRPGDPHYLPLVDLKRALEQFSISGNATVLDFGCGGSPYRGLFGKSEYRRADYLEGSGLDYLIVDGKPLNEKEETFDIVLSTQVLEHVDDYRSYLRECYRLLKKGGRLLLSTHGTFPDHPCPTDYQRWTADGLVRDLKTAGFGNVSPYKLTTGPRAVLYFYEQQRDLIRLPRKRVLGACNELFRWLMGRRLDGFHRLADQAFPGCRVVGPDDVGKHTFYVCLLVEACKV